MGERSSGLRPRPGTAAISRYPSPATDYVAIESSAGSVLSGVPTNTRSRVLLPVAARERSPLTALATGLYLLRLDDSSVFKIVKE